MCVRMMRFVDFRDSVSVDVVLRFRYQRRRKILVVPSFAVRVLKIFFYVVKEKKKKKKKKKKKR
ncbi:unnamed protein product [Eruca vesicaria subsp. sativa]|uniref:Uncharacterized protein n=1 Tax=Eruca vesicaria subsp. sativa TaxID=29727 RepID=A0ABC8KHY1_ERUVS|nr:unnamed protein product [Eruca vesicaria subsp. sativa]